MTRLVLGAVLAAAVGAGAGGALVAWWLLGRAYDAGYRTGTLDRRPDPAHRTRAFRMPRATR